MITPGHLRTHRALLLFVLLLAFLLRVFHLGTESIWLDEAGSIRQAQLPFMEMIAATARDNFPPLHNVFLHFWIKLFGTSEGYGFQDRVRECIASGSKRIVIDLGRVARVDSSGVGILVSLLFSGYRARGGVVLASIPSNIKDLLRMQTVVGQNGRIWLRAPNLATLRLAMKAFRIIEDQAHTSKLTDRIHDMLQEEVAKLRSKPKAIEEESAVSDDQKEDETSEEVEEETVAVEEEEKEEKTETEDKSEDVSE